MKNSINTTVLLRRLPFIVIGIGFWIMFFFGTYKVLSYVRSIEFFGEIISKKLFSMIFFSLMGFLILSNLITSISSFYLSKDIPFLLSKPLDMRHVIRVKSFETVVNSSWMVMSFVPPVFIAYGVSYNASFGFYTFTLIAFILFLLVTAGIGISMAHILARAFPAKRTREVLLGIGFLLFLLLYFAMKFLMSNELSTPENFINSIMTFKIDSPLLPSYWITEAVTPMLEERNLELLFSLVLLINSAFFLVISELIGLRLYRKNLGKIQPAGKDQIKGFFRGIYPNRNNAIIYKDIKIFFRDTGQWSQIFIIGALIMVYIYNFKSIPINVISGLSPFIKDLLVLVNMVLGGLVLAAVAARFLYASVSLEGQAFWVIRTSPVDMNRFLWSKFLYGCIPVSILIVFLISATNFAIGVSGLLMSASLVTALTLCISVSGLGTGFGAIYPKFKYENVASISMSLGGMAFMLIAFCVVLATLSLEAWIFYISRIKPGIGIGISTFDKIQIALSIILIILINASAFYFPMRIGRKKIHGHADSF
jgi:ABC-2 type transport system permease protein